MAKRKADMARISLEELKRELDALERGSFAAISDDELRERVKQIHEGLSIQAPIVPADKLIFRAVKVTQRPVSKPRISYPPPQAVRTLGRCNRAGEVMFYGAFNQFVSCIQELSWQPGDLFAVSAWLTTAQMAFNHLGYSAETLTRFRALRELPFFSNPETGSDRNWLIRQWQARVFAQRVPGGEEHLYRLPIALKEAALWAIGQPNPKGLERFSGIIYPSIATSALADNVAILPSEVDAKMALLEVNFLTVDSARMITGCEANTAAEMRVISYDCARSTEDGILVWGQESQILPKGVEGMTVSDLRILPPDGGWSKPCAMESRQ
ncbi:MAG: hypothetical protein ABSF53_05305 [Terracidiphilus sp.]|jgi:hypothetical protein